MICYVYKWTHTPTLKWYVGSRTRKNSHPNDGYICSSKYVKPLIKSNPEQWQRTIIATGSVEEMKELEQEILTATDAMNDSRSFNLSNGCGSMRSQVAWNRGLTGVQVAWNKGLPAEQHPMFGKINKRDWRPSAEHNAQTSKKMLENNPNKIKVICPHCGKEGAKPAMIRFHFNNCGLIRQGE